MCSIYSLKYLLQLIQLCMKYFEKSVKLSYRTLKNVHILNQMQLLNRNWQLEITSKTIVYIIVNYCKSDEVAAGVKSEILKYFIIESLNPTSGYKKYSFETVNSHSETASS